MVQLWRVREGANPTGGFESRWLSLSLDLCKERFGLRQADFVKSYPPEGVLAVGPKFGNINDNLAGVREPALLVIEIEAEEAEREGWRAGFYLAPVTLKEANSV
jgi:hypothetical protein